MVITAKKRGVLHDEDRAANERAIKDYFTQKFPAFVDEYGIEVTTARKGSTKLFVVRYFSIKCCICGYDALCFFLFITFEELNVYMANTIVYRNASNMPVNILLKKWLK